MNTKNDLRGLIVRPSALAPVVMSLAAFAVVTGYVVTYGVARQADEGAAAHIWQLLVGAQVPVVAFFVIKWLPKVPRAALCVLALQLVALLIAAAPVYFLHL
jgi:MFS superfamily sulfate permease-like transporter